MSFPGDADRARARGVRGIHQPTARGRRARVISRAYSFFSIFLFVSSCIFKEKNQALLCSLSHMTPTHPIAPSAWAIASPDAQIPTATTSRHPGVAHPRLFVFQRSPKSLRMAVRLLRALQRA